MVGTVSRSRLRSLLTGRRAEMSGSSARYPSMADQIREVGGRCDRFRVPTKIESHFLWRSAEGSSRVPALLALVVQEMAVAGRCPRELGAAVGARGLRGLARLLALMPQEVAKC